MNLESNCQYRRWPLLWLTFTLLYTCSQFVSPHETHDSSNYTEQRQNVWPEHRPDQRPLNQFIVHHELLSYSSKHIHQRLKRSASSNQQQPSQSNPLHIEFYSHGKRFLLRLHPDAHSVFSKSVEFVDADGRKLDMPLDHLYSGHLQDEPSTSHVHGHVIDGLFEGRIHSREGTFYVERLHRYPHVLGRKKKAHSVIYRAEDVRHPQSDKFEGGCGDDEVRRWMEQISNSPVLGTESFKPDRKSVDYTNIHKPSHSLPHLMYSIEQNQPSSQDHNDSAVLHRYKRAGDQYIPPLRIPHFLSNPFDEDLLRNPAFRISYDNKHRNPPNGNGAGLFDSVVSESQQNRRACSLYIQTDTYLWEHIRREVSSDLKAREEISSLVAQHIKAVNHIYENSDFGGIRGLKFIVQRLRVNDSSACDTQRKRDQNQFCSPNIDVSNFLNLNSQFNHDDFCLAYIFTYRDFSGGTLGLAWVASTSGASGGICEKYKSYTENVHGKQVQTKRSLNTGIITFVNYNSRVPPKVSELTLAHEIGHNFGSPHDYPADCRPGGQAGNYIMYSSATSGERSNNNKFSPCSMRNISSVLAAVFSSEGKHNCFEKHEGPFCGNKIVEENEECDCGYDAKECTDRCCHPRDAGEHLRCRRTKGAACSPSEGPCCTETCDFVGSTSVCRTSSECTYKSFCNGLEAHCPQPAFRPNNTECNGGTQVCLSGQCAGSICLKHKLQECFLTSKNARPDEMCEVACQRGSEPNSCRRISEIVKMSNISGLKLKPGSPCNDFQGYCDVFQRCRAVDAEGPIARLRNLLLNHKTLMSIRQWATTHWWVCMLMGVGLVLFMAAFIKCCAVHTPSSNPKKRPAVRIQDTLRHPADTLRRKRYRSAQQGGRRHPHSAHPSGHGPNSIPLQATGAPSNAALHGTGTPYQQTQLVVALPPEGAAAVSNRVAGDPPPPYPANASSSTAQTVTTGASAPSSSSSASSSSQQPPPLPQRPSQLGIPLQHNNSAHSSSSSSSHKNLLPSRGFGHGRGHYNRQGQANVPTASKSQPSSASKPQSGRSKK